MTTVLLIVIAAGVWTMAAETLVLVYVRLRDRRRELHAAAVVLRERDEAKLLQDARVRQTGGR